MESSLKYSCWPKTTILLKRIALWSFPVNFGNFSGLLFRYVPQVTASINMRTMYFF